MPFTWARNSQYFKRYEQKTDFSTHFWVLEGSLVVQLVSKVVGNGLETHLLTFASLRHPLWTILGVIFGSFWAYFGPFLGHFQPKMDQKWGVRGPKRGPRGSKMAPKWPKNDQKHCRNTLNHLYSWPIWTPIWPIFGHFFPPPPQLASAHDPGPCLVKLPDFRGVQHRLGDT